MSSGSLSYLQPLIQHSSLVNNFFTVFFFQGSYIYSMGMRSNVLCYQQACKTCHKYKHCLRKHSQTRLREVETTVKRSTSRTIPVESFMNWTVLGNYLIPCTFFTVKPSQAYSPGFHWLILLIIWKMNPLVINCCNQSNLNLHSCMCNKQ